jgi:hypothetical protein
MRESRFKPQAVSTTEGEEQAYRRGYDQGMTSALLALGLTIEEVRNLHLKQRSEAFRHGDQKFPPWDATWKEKKELRDAVLSVTREQLYGLDTD